VLSKTVVLHNAQIDKTVMIHATESLHSTTLRTVLWGIASHLKVGLMQAESLGWSKDPRGRF
jgi:hypothetical protein